MALALSSYHGELASPYIECAAVATTCLAEGRRSHSLPSRLNARGRESVNYSRQLRADRHGCGGAWSAAPPSAPPLKAGLPWKTLTSLTIGLALLITMAEISRLSGSMLDTVGQAWSFNELIGFGSFSSRAGWRADFTGAFRVRGIFLAVYVAADLAFILIYWTLIRRFWKRRFDGGTLRNRRALLLILVAADVIEDVLALGTLALRGQANGALVAQRRAGCRELVKSLACVVVAFVVMRDLLTGGGRTVRRSLKEIYEWSASIASPWCRWLWSRWCRSSREQTFSIRCRILRGGGQTGRATSQWRVAQHSSH